MIPDDLSNFENDITELVEKLKNTFNSQKARWFHHEQSDTLYVEISGLEAMSDDIIADKAGPVLDELDLDFEEIVLLPYS